MRCYDVPQIIRKIIGVAADYPGLEDRCKEKVAERVVAHYASSTLITALPKELHVMILDSLIERRCCKLEVIYLPDDLKETKNDRS